jgi:hypothetical protein
MKNQMNPTLPQTVLVFKTNLNAKEDISKIEKGLNNLQGVLDWSVDISDIDKVLRVEANTDNPFEILSVLHTEGYQCEELNY